MKASPVTQNIEFTIGTCPLCKAAITVNATVEITFTLGPVEYSDAGTATAKVDGNPAFRKISVHHDCNYHEAADDH